MEKPNNNLFNFASSELSQDAMLCWLINWADSDFSDRKEIHEAGRLFLEDIIKLWNDYSKSSISLPNKLTLKIFRHINETDISVIINNKILICIEDKTRTSYHSNQLERCRESVLNNYEYYNMDKVFIFFKTYDFIPDTYLKNSNFVIYDRCNLINFIDKIDFRTNDILHNYAEYILKLDSRSNAFRSDPIDLWQWDAILRFHSEIARHVPGMEGRYVANGAGGFLGCWGSQINVLDEMVVYLQVETKPRTPVQSKLYFKMSELKSQADVRSVRQGWYESLKTAAAGFQIGIEKTRWRTGGTMAIAAMPGEFRATDGDGHIDMKKTLEKWQLASSILAEAAKIHAAQCNPH